jgi:hypothetical protein
MGGVKPQPPRVGGDQQSVEGLSNPPSNCGQSTSAQVKAPAAAFIHQKLNYPSSSGGIPE